MKKEIKSSKGFTLVELMVTISIIGILASVTIVSMKSSVDKSKKAAAITSLSSVLPELVTCQDDNGTINAFNSSPAGTGGNQICNATGHSATWPNLIKSGYTTVSAPATTTAAAISSYTFTASNGTDTITCKYVDNGCS